MEGVQILNQFEVVTESAFNWLGFWIGAAIGFGAVALIIFLCLIGTGDYDWAGFLICIGTIGIISAVFVGLFIGCGTETPVEYETHYEVCINEEVNMQEFTDKYEIIKTRGSIFTVREK